MGRGLQSPSLLLLSAVIPSAGMDLLLIYAKREWGRGAGVLLPRGVARGVQDGDRLAGTRCPPCQQGEAWWSGGERQLYQSCSGDRQEQIHAVVLGREQESPPPAG